MKKLPAIWAAMFLGLFLATPALAGHGAHRGGQFHHVVRGPAFGISAIPVPRLPVPRIHSSISLSLGFPIVPLPVIVSPAPIYYVSRPVYAAPRFERVWVPGGSTWNGGVPFYVEGHWSYRRCHDRDDD
jgi:hypothetical protein